MEEEMKIKNENIEDTDEDFVNSREEIKKFREKTKNYDKFAPLVPGTIVCSSYYTFEGEERTGVFCVLYDEMLDNGIFESRNVIACKVSSQNTLISNYSCGINRLYNDYLDKDCIVCCSKIHVLHKTHNVYRVLGVLDRNTYSRVVKTYTRFRREVERQMFDRL